MTIEVAGAARLRRTLRRAGADLQDLRAAHREAADYVVAKQEPQAPVGPTGRLARSVRAGATQRQALVRAGGARVPYAGPIHWGWKKRNIESQPWLHGTVTHNQEQIVEIYQDGVEAIVDTIEGT